MKKVVFLILILLIFLFYSTTTAFSLNCKKGNFMYKKTIAIDLDGVLDEYDGKYDKDNIPNLRIGAKDFVAALSKDYNLILFTTREPKKAKKWLIESNLDEYFTDITNKKPLAYVYIDDRALKFEGDYNKTLNEIKNFKVYWKN